jgi:hypothetical protein
MIKIVEYNAELRNIWDDFIKGSKNPLFMFERNYMEYHQDRFKDNSLLFYEINDQNHEKEELIALLPMNIKDQSLYSHGGLTYGGFITNNKMKQHLMLDCIEALKEYAKDKGFMSIIYKQIPYIYHLQPAEEDRYALFLNDASLIKVEASTVINLDDPIKMPKGRKAQISRAKREGVIVEEKTSLEDFKAFIALENEVLESRHGTDAVHTGDELFLLHSRFPDKIHLFAAMHNEAMIAGTVVFEYQYVVHTQYMAANDEARTIGALDLAVKTVIDKYKDNKKWLDFGISTEDGGKILNHGLIGQKEGFGGRTVAYMTWKLSF